jgi:hypothetical protein
MRRAGRVHEVFWKSTKPLGSEYCAVERKGAGWSLAGTLARRFKGGTMVANYEIRTDRGWRTQEAQVEGLLKGRHAEVRLEVRRGRWFVNGRGRDDLKGCLDVDLGASPVTNTLPIKRAGLGVGEKADLTAAWVRFPDLDVVPLDQSYERLGGSRYIYRSSSGFKAEVVTDGFGLVRKYGGYWESA